MSEYFYGDSPYAVWATKPQMMAEIEKAREIIAANNLDLTVLGINKLYRTDLICRESDSNLMYHYDTSGGRMRKQYEFRGYGGDAWEQAPNLVKVEDLELGQMELF